MQIVRVALDIPLSTVFDYFLAENLTVVAGQRVVVPFGRKQVVGVVMEVGANTELSVTKIKEVVQILEDVAPMPEEKQMPNFPSSKAAILFCKALRVGLAPRA